MVSRCRKNNLLLVVAAIFACDLALADEFELDSADLRDIRSQVLAEHAELSSSPGVKFVQADRWIDGEEFAYVIYHPHVDSGGVRQAFQVACTRPAPETQWQCEDAQIRRYVRVEGQAFEVRVVGDISADAILAAIEATRRALPEEGGDGAYTAIIARPAETGYTVQWANDRENVVMHATLSDQSDAATPDAWQVSRYLFPALDTEHVTDGSAPDQ